MNILKGATLAAVAAGLSLVLAVPALADEGFNGVYRYIPDLGDSVNVTISSNCETDGCVAHIAGERGNVQGDAIFNGGLWTLSVRNPVGDICEGKRYPADQVYTWDANTLQGTLTSAYGPACDGTSGVATTAFTLTKVS
ncbi:MAG TPA: hypothetical protein PLI79_20350 [Mycobacterium sp.]|nr:hypothetical protein [Planctomycetales bacterium]MCB0934961.1 hypothetical protein [Mycobacterium sp.]MCB0938659.1 hypothetical protein [Mycobacterium sp.]HRD14208.1 hypothetical protein [Mycobacterium sp.]